MIELLQGGLKNDSNAETFSLKHTIDNRPFPCSYIKIVPILSWGASFNFSVWYVELQGECSSEVIEPCLQWYHSYREREAIRLCLKHFRQQNYLEAFASLQKKTKITLEDPLLTRLHDLLVNEGDFEGTEAIISDAIQDDLFSGYVSRQDYKVQWEVMVQPACQEKPGMRGGHQMCMDHVNNCLYLHGGWNGSEDLADFWRYSVDTHEWTCLSHDTRLEGGPSARSCHKMCIDSTNGVIYTLGRYLDSSKRNRTSVENDFHAYSITENKWKLISKNVALEGGPRLIFDHQVCFDEGSNTIFVFGGRVITCLPTPRALGTSLGTDERPVPEFSGLYSYHVSSDTWKLLREDSGNAGPQDVRSRIGHSMLLDTKHRRLYIFGGQRSKEYVNDFFYYDINQDHVRVIHDGLRNDPGLPPSGFTQRATINSELQEIHMLSGLSKDREKREENMQNSFWVYMIRDNRWNCVYRNEQPFSFPNNPTKRPYSSREPPGLEPCPRYAHQLVYDPQRQIHYMFGGNPGKTTQPKLRLDDFWLLRLNRPGKYDLQRKCLFIIRRQHFRERARQDPIRALRYLQTSVSETVDHQNEKEAKKFRNLTSTLFGDPEAFDSDSDGEKMEDQSSSASTSSSGKSSSSSKHQFSLQEDPVRAGRIMLFDTLVSFFPENMTQPKTNLLDLITF